MKDWTRRGILAATAMLPATTRAEGLAGPGALVADAGALPPLAWTGADGMPHTLADHARQKVILNFWATWCVPCVAEMPALERLAVARPDIVVLALSSDRNGAAAVARFYAANAIGHLPVLLDPRGEAARAAGARGLPTTLAIAPGGRLVARAEGAVAWDGADMNMWLDTYLVR